MLLFSKALKSHDLAAAPGLLLVLVVVELLSELLGVLPQSLGLGLRELLARTGVAEVLPDPPDPQLLNLLLSLVILCVDPVLPVLKVLDFLLEGLEDAHLYFEPVLEFF